MSDHLPSRREVIRHLVVLGAAGALPGCGILGLGGPTEVAPVEKIAEGSALRATVKEQPVILVNIGGRIRAFSGLCTHESCELGWNQRQQLIRCPCHGSGFTPDGKVKMGPATLPLPEYPTSVRDGRVFVDL
jgi:cytochrome b6-f complex iron-sulfur subunit